MNLVFPISIIYYYYLIEIDPTILCFQCDEEWKKNERSYEWSSRNEDTIVMALKECNILFVRFVEKLYE